MFKNKIKNVIYIITNKTNGKSYIGLATNYRDRLKQHLSQLRRNVHYNKHFQRAWNKYGEENFIFEVVDQVDTPEELQEREIWWMKTFVWDNLYNQCLEAGFTLGYRHSEKAKKAITAALTGRQVSKKTRERIGNAHRGKKLSERTKKKIGEKSKGRKRTKKSTEQGTQTKIERYGSMPDCKTVAQIDPETDEIIAIYKSISEAASTVNVTPSNISAVCNGYTRYDKKGNKRYTRKTSGGFKWKFVEELE